jgi:hypothetical protein
MRDWMERMGLAAGGETIRGLREQAARISACNLKFFWEDDKHRGWTRGGIVKSGLRFKADNDTQQRFWEDKVILDETFYQSLLDHPVPLQEAAIRELRDRSMSIDVYVWLAYRCHLLEKPVSITWPSIFTQFGAGFTQLKNFKPKFGPAIAAAVAAYPESRVDITDEGINVYPARSPMARLASAS